MGEEVRRSIPNPIGKRPGSCGKFGGGGQDHLWAEFAGSKLTA